MMIGVVQNSSNNLNGGYKYSSKEQMMEATKANKRAKYHANKDLFLEKQRQYRAKKKQIQPYVVEAYSGGRPSDRHIQEKYIQQQLDFMYCKERPELLQQRIFYLRKMLEELENNVIGIHDPDFKGYRYDDNRTILPSEIQEMHDFNDQRQPHDQKQSPVLEIVGINHGTVVNETQVNELINNHQIIKI